MNNGKRAMRIHVMKPQPKKPNVGDRRITKAHGLQVRIFLMHGNGHVVNSKGAFRYEWVTIDRLPERYHHYLTPEERASLPKKAA